MSCKWTRDEVESSIDLIQQHSCIYSVCVFFILYFHSQEFANKSLRVEKLSQTPKETNKKVCKQKFARGKGDWQNPYKKSKKYIFGSMFSNLTE